MKIICCHMQAGLLINGPLLIVCDIWYTNCKVSNPALFFLTKNIPAWKNIKFQSTWYIEFVGVLPK